MRPNNWTGGINGFIVQILKVKGGVMGTVTSIEDVRDSIELNKHLEGQGMSEEEEAIINAKFQSFLSGIVKSRICDIKSEDVLDALSECESEWENLCLSYFENRQPSSPCGLVNLPASNITPLARLFNKLMLEIEKAVLKQAEEDFRNEQDE